MPAEDDDVEKVDPAEEYEEPELPDHIPKSTLKK